MKPSASSTTSARPAPSRSATSGGAGDSSQYKRQVEELNEKLITMEQSLESLERVRIGLSKLRFDPFFWPVRNFGQKSWTRVIKILIYLFQERDFYFEKLRDIELMITNIAGEEAESPADPNSDLGQMSKKVCLCTFFYIPVINLIISIVLSEHVINILISFWSICWRSQKLPPKKWLKKTVTDSEQIFLVIY